MAGIWIIILWNFIAYLHQPHEVRIIIICHLTGKETEKTEISVAAEPVFEPKQPSSIYHPSESSELPKLISLLHMGKTRLCPFSKYWILALELRFQSVWAGTKLWNHFTVTQQWQPSSHWGQCSVIWEVFHCIVSFHIYNRSVRSSYTSFYRKNTDAKGRKTDWPRLPKTLCLGSSSFSQEG